MEQELNEIYEAAFNDELEKIAGINKEAIAPLFVGAASLGVRALPWLARGASKLFTRGAAKFMGRSAASGAAFEGGSMALKRGARNFRRIQ